MPLSLKLPELDSNPILLAETRPNKINAFIEDLPYSDPISAASDLVEELQVINSQVVAFSNRVNALEIYRQAAVQIHADLLPHYSNSSLPISKNDMAFSNAAEQMWQELAYGYKAALIDLQNKIINLNIEKSTALIVQRAIYALKEILFIKLLTYRTPPSTLWAEMHQLYFCALQQDAEHLVVSEVLPKATESTANKIYIQALLLSLANTHRLSNLDIVKTDAYLTSLSDEADLKGVGFVDSANGVFLVELDSDKPPTSYAKRKATPELETDLLLVTVKLARRIHTHIKLLREGVVPNDGSLPNNAVIERYEDLLSHLITYFGKSPLRAFTRIKQTDGMELGININDAHHFIPKIGHDFKELVVQSASIKPSRWQVLNSSAGGFALRKFNSSQVAMYIGDIAAIKNNTSLTWEVGVVRWANINELNQLDAGFELISPLAKSIYLKKQKSTIRTKAILLPKLNTLKQISSIIVPRDEYGVDTPLTLFDESESSEIKLTKLVERTVSFERYQYELIQSD